jgi:hypothetical protein
VVLHRRVAREHAVRRARRPWNSAVGKRGRPRKEPSDQHEGCIWPMPTRRGGTCGDPPAEGVALCPEHAKVLGQPPGERCAWPDCEQTSPFNPLCAYHTKRALGLLGPWRP